MLELEGIDDVLRDRIRALSTVYRDPGHYDVLAQMTAPDDLPFYRAVLGAPPQRLLELGAGTGRLSVPLAADGHEVVGVELSPELLAAAKARAEHEDVALTLALGDFRTFALGRTFDVVIMAYNAFNHLLDAGAMRACLAAVHEHLEPDGRFVLDTFQPDLTFLARGAIEDRALLRYRDPYTHHELVLFEDDHYDSATQTNRIVWRYLDPDGAEVRRDELTMRIVFPAELDAVLALAGFERIAKYGNYDREPFESASPKQLVVCRPKVR